MIAEFQYIKPYSLEEAFEVLSKEAESIVYAGGTDILVRYRAGRCTSKTVIDVKSIIELQGITENGDQISIGATSTFSELYENELIQKAVPALAQAAKMVGSGQIQRKATIGGNICNASPAADGLTAIWALEAKVLLISSSGSRIIPLTEFVVGPGKTTIRENEILCRIFIPKRMWTHQEFFKVGRRNALAISVVNGCVSVCRDDNNKITDAAISIGACGPTPIRAYSSEKHIIGKTLSKKWIREMETITKAEVAPISDLRASAEYRRYAAASSIAAALQRFEEQRRVW